MASKPEFVAYVCDQLRDAGEISYKKMFGEYGIYCDGKMVAMVCNDQFFVKKTEAGSEILPGCPLIEEPEDREVLARLLRATWEELPFPKPRRRAGKS